ncbi:DUF4157 domain-containing protein [Nodularia spumigena CS-586/05]|uniref:eCIS core domain-containing protein n=1 Tax=Nodularia spumigena TaxID=70799 RepID=UPI00232C4CE0|nr:DUF4157 domain-containing protein [Nodularia spumigena]MDB9343303.1 DUF4157 domain-containing protein [Nodularia spumigena CS-588/06]MDB9368166.1 DUF4157 domain-containing protein [Nodularia spumigena CS-586/05]
MTNQKAQARKSTSINTETQKNQFEGRGFTVQKKSDTHTQKSDLNTLLLQAKSFGHSISKLAGQESSGTSQQTNGLSIQAKLSIGEPGDRYEQEADRVASVVVQRINAPSSTGESVQREAIPEEEDELQMKPLADSIQRQEDDEEELQMKSLADSIQRVEIDDEEELQMKSQVQRREAIGGGEASTDLESSINSARGGGQAIAPNIREPMEVAFGADFSGVKVHTDGQSDQLNRSIQARAFTTGQDVFFRQGEYNPGSRGGQELLAHELTHVVQQNGGRYIDRQSPEKSKQRTHYGETSQETLQKMPYNTRTPKARLLRVENQTFYYDSSPLQQTNVNGESYGTSVESVIGPRTGQYLGSVPDQTILSNTISWLNNNLPTANQWIRGHLMNDWLGGSGSDNSNLAPMSHTTNQLWNNNFENKLKLLTERINSFYSNNILLNNDYFLLIGSTASAIGTYGPAQASGVIIPDQFVGNWYYAAYRRTDNQVLYDDTSVTTALNELDQATRDSINATENTIVSVTNQVH